MNDDCIYFVCCLGTADLPSLFRTHYYQLCKAVSSQPDVITPLADILYGAGLIAYETRLAVLLTSGLTPYDRASRLVSQAELVAQDSMQKARKFCECLQECGIPVPDNILKGEVDLSLLFLFWNANILFVLLMILRINLLKDAVYYLHICNPIFISLELRWW